MALPTADQIETLIEHFSHGVGTDYDPRTQIGCQRESSGDLGFGWLYWSLARVLQPRRILVIGSGRGFSVACLALGVQELADAQLIFVDPGLETWSVENTPDRADGMWKTADETLAHFRTHLGLTQLQFLRLCSDAAFQGFLENGDRFDLIYVDGEHSYAQSLTDLRNAAACLARSGIILAHDSCCAYWPGVAFALATLGHEAPWLESFSLSCFPGLSLIKFREPLVQIRPVSPRENDQINAWRIAAGVYTRPLHDGDDPRPGLPGADPREGLFGIFEGDALIGGFGLRRRIFDRLGPDNFLPDCGKALTGSLCYGVVLHPEMRRRRRWQLVTSELLRWFGEEGFYLITEYPQAGRDAPYSIERVGSAPPYTAFRCRPGQSTLGSAPSAERAVEVWRQYESQVLAKELLQQHAQARELQTQLAQMADSLAFKRREIDELREQLACMSRDRDALLGSTSWRWTYSARIIGKWARLVEKRLGRHGRRLTRQGPMLSSGTHHR